MFSALTLKARSLALWQTSFWTAPARVNADQQHPRRLWQSYDQLLGRGCAPSTDISPTLRRGIANVGLYLVITKCFPKPRLPIVRLVIVRPISTIAGSGLKIL